MYFSKFPYTYYSLDDVASVQVIKNILMRVQISEEIKDNLSVYDEYDITDGETPEIIADRFYGNSQYHWIVLHMNDIIDPRFDWPLSTHNLIKYCESKYDNINSTHHYVDTNGYVVNSTATGATSVTNFQYEEALNEEKRRIKVLKPQYIDAVVQEFNAKIQAINE
jgi:hypothetical protein